MWKYTKFIFFLYQNTKQVKYLHNKYTVPLWTEPTERSLFLEAVVFPDDVYEVVFGDQGVVRPRLSPLPVPPLLLVEVGWVEELRRQDGARGLDPVHHLQEQPLVVVVEEGDGCSPVAQPTRPTHLDRKREKGDRLQDYD